jgi:hypothetical protein
LILLDTDLNTDVGDAGAIALLHAFADAGEAEIVGVGVSVSNPDTPYALLAANQWYGRGAIPIGQYQGEPPLVRQGDAGDVHRADAAAAAGHDGTLPPRPGHASGSQRHDGGDRFPQHAAPADGFAAG